MTYGWRLFIGGLAGAVLYVGMVQSVGYWRGELHYWSRFLIMALQGALVVRIFIDKKGLENGTGTILATDRPAPAD